MNRGIAALLAVLLAWHPVLCHGGGTNIAPISAGRGSRTIPLPAVGNPSPGLYSPGRVSLPDRMVLPVSSIPNLPVAYPPGPTTAKSFSTRRSEQHPLPLTGKPETQAAGVERSARERPARRSIGNGPHASPSLRRRVATLHSGQLRDLRALASAGAESAHGIASEGFSRLLGLDTLRYGVVESAVRARHPWASSGLAYVIEHGVEPDDDPPEPPAASEKTKKDLRLYLTGTAVFKVGMDSLSLSMPLLALSAFGSASWAATFTVAWVFSQAVFSSMAGGLLDRRSPVKTLSWAMALQAASVTAMLGLFAADAFFPGALGFQLANPFMLLALYGLSGGLLGASETARQILPPRIVGNDERALKTFNAKTHTAYEIAGVAIALLAGVSIKFLGLLPTLMIHPPAYLLAAFLFSRLRLAPAPRQDAELARPSPRPGSKPFEDFLDGARTVFSKPVYVWSMAALVIPLVIHKVFEGLLLPVTAKVLLDDPPAAAWLLGASNLGELLGALLLMKVLISPKSGASRHSHYWVRLMGLGLLTLWALALTGQLWILLPLAAVKSVTWAASDLSLRSKLQNGLPQGHRGRALGFINSVAFLLILAASLGLGFVLDTAAPLTVFHWIGGAVSLSAAFMLLAAHRIKRSSDEIIPPSLAQ